MIIECQNCNKKFQIDDALIPKNGRLVKCGSCNTTWQQKPEIIILEDKLTEITQLSEQEKEKPVKKKIPISIKIKKKDIREKKIGILSSIVVFIISIISLFLIIETFQYEISLIFPNTENYISYVYETLKNILILSKDLFKTY